LFKPAVYAGLAAQLPIALVGFLAARALLRVADEAAGTLAPQSAFSLGEAAALPTRVRPAFVPSLLAFDRLGRAPPRRTIRSASR